MTMRMMRALAVSAALFALAVGAMRVRRQPAASAQAQATGRQPCHAAHALVSKMIETYSPNRRGLSGIVPQRLGACAAWNGCAAAVVRYLYREPVMRRLRIRRVAQTRHR